jgi:hypothetical protein
MGWPTIPPSLVASDQVTIRRAGVWTQDASGGRVRNLGPPSSPWPCSFSPVGRVPRSHSANHRDQEVVKYLVTFANVNPNLHENDELFWVAESKTLVVVQTVTNGTSDSRLWGAFVEERPAV